MCTPKFSRTKVTNIIPLIICPKPLKVEAFKRSPPKTYPK